MSRRKRPRKRDRQALKQRVVDLTLRRLEAIDADPRTGRDCLPTAAVLADAAEDLGVYLRVQVGSVWWRAVAPEHDIGKSTHYAFVVDDWLAGGQRGREFHAWAVEPATGELVDLTTRGFVRRWCEVGQGQPWTAPEPPDWVWCRNSQLPSGVRYVASREARGRVLAASERDLLPLSALRSIARRAVSVDGDRKLWVFL